MSQNKKTLKEDLILEKNFDTLSYEDQLRWLAKKYPEAKIDWNYEHNVSICERSKTIIEPLISEEFFLNFHQKAKSTSKSLQEHGLEGVAEVNFYSDDFKERAVNFLENINNWCISRDLIWGHKIPVWYNLKTNPNKIFYPAQNNQESNQADKMQISMQKPETEGDWVQEEKILDTWFSSALWPLTTLDYQNYKNQQQDLLIVHGGSTFEKEEDFLESLKNWKLSPEDYLDIEKNWGSWKKDLQKSLSASNIRVSYPKFPNKLNAKYKAWKIWFEKILKNLESENLNLVGHSLGGNFLLKYLSENNLKIKNLYLVAACINEGDFTITDFSKVEENSQKIYIYHSKDDKNVDFKVALEIKAKLAKASLVEMDYRGHFLMEKFPILKNQILQDLTLDRPILDFERFYPTQEITTAKEIFYIWIVRMIVLAKYFTNIIPFENVVITPTVLDEKGKKMSKSLGNGLNPVKAIQDYSSDSLRLAMLSGMIPNRNIKMGGQSADRIMEKYRNFGNKLWNVARFLESLDQD